MERVQSALELFKRYHARYPRIDMAPLHLGGITEAGRLYLMPARDGKPLADRQLLAMRKYPYLDLFKAGIRARTDFKPERGQTPQTQQEQALWKKVEREYFARRRFELRLGQLPGWYSVSLVDAPMFPARFSAWRRMRGLVLEPAPTEPALYVHWSSFVPEDTPEHDAIQASLDLAHIARKKPIRPSKDEIERLQGVLREKIAAVPS